MDGDSSPDWLRNATVESTWGWKVNGTSRSSVTGGPDQAAALNAAPTYSSSPDSTPDFVLPEVNTTNRIEEDSPLASALGAGNVVKGAQPGEGISKRRGRPPGKKNQAKSSAVEEDEIPEDDDDEEDVKVISSRRPRRGKRLADSDEDDEEFKPPTKTRKIAPSPKVKKQGVKSPSSSRKNKRVSISEEEEDATVKRVKREIVLEPVEAEDEEDETAPISNLSSAKQAASKPALESASSDSAAVSKLTKGRPGTNALRALVEDEVVYEDGIGLSQMEDPVTAEETGEPSERKPKRISSTLPVIFAEKIHRTKVLLECEDDALDLSGDIGAVGRFTVTGKDDAGDELSLDLKGVIYKTTIVPSNTFFVVNVGHAEAKVEAIMNDFMQLRPDVNQAGDETVVEGTMEDYGFDLDNFGDGGAPPTATTALAEGDEDDYEEKPKKKSPTKGQGNKVAASKAAKAKTKPTLKGGAKKPRAKAKTTAKKPASKKPAAPRKSKATKG